MKKILLFALALSVLTGCSNATIKPTTNEVLFTINGKTVYEGDLFETIRLSSAGYQIVKNKAQDIMLQSIVKEDDVFDKAVDDALKSIKDTMGENWELFLVTNGFETEQDYIDEILVYNVRVDLAVREEIRHDFDKIKATKPRKVQIIQVSETDAAKVLELAKAGDDFEALGKEYGLSTSSYKGQEVIINNTTSLEDTVLGALISVEEKGIISSVVKGSTTTANYVVNVVELDVEVLKEEIIETYAQDSTISTPYLNNLFVKHGFEVYDIDLYEKINENYPDILTN